ncbi:tetratricopeptide repeat protein [Verrucomicrobiaceae bacterium 5K15]|uniref:Tetratricopeptide repeat protein n=1 Tax=Oceaniferula flava TaxID=2800421 RepID=A0AAE2V905_9BACT|nr:tetratricopeptide repeat protein [Oceaniferula flavus]MBK1856287.1 tetratricopeptide repeat protein [Oceaniferula flavus]MBM1137594.1 tetratricopeptide repeat protein [Oceaniferula flavus]
MRIYALIFALAFAALPASAQDAPLAVNPANDQFEFCKHLYRQANAMQDHEQRVQAYQRLIPRLEAYVAKFPNNPNTPAASYYLGECYYQSGAVDQAKRVLSGVVNRFRTGRYVALASNRLGYDAFYNKKYRQAAVHFDRVARLSDTPTERARGRYQEASCYRFAGDNNAAIRAYTTVETSEKAPPVYRENAKLRLGHLYLAKKDLDKAMEKFSALLLPGVAASLRVEATFNCGLIALEQDDTDLAKGYLKSVLLSTEDKHKPRAQAALMNCMFATKDYRGVLDTLKRGAYKGKPSTEAIKYTIAGKSALQLKSYNEAIRYFAKAESQIPLSEEAFTAAYYRLLCFFNVEGVNIPQQVDGFLEVYQKRYPKHTRIHKALLMKAETLFDSGKSREAADAYNQIETSLVGKENIPNLLYKRAWCLSESGDHNGAVRSFTDFINSYPEDPRSSKAIARRGKSYMALGDRGSALRDFDLLIQRFPKDKLAALAWQSSARIKKEDKDYKDMIRRYEQMLKNFPDLMQGTVANAHYWIGWGSYQLKDYAKAIASLDKALTLEPDSYGFQAGMLTVYCSYSMKDKARLQQAVDSILTLGKGDKVQNPIYRWLGVQCFNADEMKSAERYLTLGTTASEPRQTPKSFWKMLGSARVETGKYEEALEAIKNFLDVAEEPFWKAETLLDQAKAYLGLEKLAEAKTSAEEGLQLRPKGSVNSELRMVLGDIAYNQKDYDTAAGLYVVAVELFTDDQKLRPEALLKAYQALEKKGDQEQAKHYLNTLNKEFPNYLKQSAAPDAP